MAWPSHKLTGDSSARQGPGERNSPENAIFMVCVLSCNSLIDAGIRFYLFLVCFAIQNGGAE